MGELLSNTYDLQLSNSLKQKGSCDFRACQVKCVYTTFVLVIVRGWGHETGICTHKCSQAFPTCRLLGAHHKLKQVSEST